jgi:predicted Zn-dependent protease
VELFNWWGAQLAAAQRAGADLAGAERAYRQGIVATHDSGLYVGLALLLDDAQRHDEARTAYEEGLQRNPGSPVLANNLAMALISRQPDAAALSRAESLVSGLADSEDAAYLDTIGWVHYKAGRLADAQTQLARAVEKRPEAPLLRYHYAQVLADRGSIDEALDQVNEALKAKGFSQRAQALALKAQLDRLAAPGANAGA